MKLPEARKPCELDDDPDNMTLAILLHVGELLLGFKSRGIGEGTWMLPGGKYLGDICTSADGVDVSREVRQETGLELDAERYSHVAQLAILDEIGRERWVEVYRAQLTDAEAASAAVPETSDGKPPEFSALRFFPTPPYDLMLPDHRLWLPRVLTGATTPIVPITLEL